DVGEVLITLLRDNMGIPPETIMLISPGEIEANDNVRLSLFLYQVRENAYLRNQEMQQIDPAHLRNPPLPLELYYMLTAYPSSGISDRTERTEEEHRILGKAIQILYDNTMPAISDYELRITLNTMSLDDMTKIWTTFQGKSYRPSACYLITPVYIDSLHEISIKRVESKETDSGQMKPNPGEE
ncbi:MAG: DUF4255 domain-containing protein, partial [Candidatus Methanoperedens sp.]|nr:DUF4255 domain-containing protein [Candidatus Methanoperedens sp.]